MDEDIEGVLMAIENELRLLAAQQWRTAGVFLANGDTDRSNKAQGIYEGLQTAIQAVSEKRRGLGGERDDRGHRESTQQTGSDPKTSARD